MTAAKSAIRIASILVIRTSPGLASTADSMTSRTASSNDMMKRVMPGSLSVTGPPLRLWCRKIGTTDPREPRTLPKRVDRKTEPE